MESVTEQLCPMILAMNGYSGPVPHIVPIGAPNSDEARADAFLSLGELRKSGIITVALPEPTQLMIIRNLMEPLDITVDEIEPEQPAIEPEAEAEAESVPAPVKAAEGKRHKQARLQVERFNAEIDKRAADLSATWASIMPGVMDQLSKALFENKPGGGWKTTDLALIRQTITDKVRYKSSDIRNSLTAGFDAARKLGLDAAADTIPIQAAGVKKYGWTSASAKQALANRILFLLENKYGMLTSSIYYAVENALIGNLSILEAESAIRDLLHNSPWAEGRAITVMDTAMSSAWNAARMEQYRLLENPDGTGMTDIVAYEFLAVEDEHTTDTCMDLNGKVFSVDDPSLPLPPLHYNCRSVLLPVFGNERDKVEIMDRADSASTVDRLIRNGGIQEGFGGV
jgi:SPP1 gp7 family putative phage head morphogenesis protein